MKGRGLFVYTMIVESERPSVGMIAQTLAFASIASAAVVVTHSLHFSSASMNRTLASNQRVLPQKPVELSATIHEK
jgi:hypothetical protein